MKNSNDTRKEGRDGFSSLVNLLPQTVIEFGTDGTLLFANRHAFREFRFDRGEKLIGKVNVFDYIDPSDRGRILKGMARLVAGKETEPQEMRAIRKDGTVFLFRRLNYPAEIHDGYSVAHMLYHIQIVCYKEICKVKIAL